MAAGKRLEHVVCELKLLVFVSRNQMDASVIHVVDTEHRAGVWIKGGA